MNPSVLRQLTRTGTARFEHPPIELKWLKQRLGRQYYFFLLIPLYPHRQRSPYFVLLILLFPTLSTQTKIIPQGVKRRVPDHDLDRNRRPEAPRTARSVPGLSFFFIFFVFLSTSSPCSSWLRRGRRRSPRWTRTATGRSRSTSGSPSSSRLGKSYSREEFVGLIDGFDGFENENGCKN